MKRRLGGWKRLFQLSVFAGIFAGVVLLTGCGKKRRF